MMDILCTNLGGDEILVENVNEVAAIYRFDDFEVEIKEGNFVARFDVPSTEWLEKFTAILNYSGTIHERSDLKFSGYEFDVSKDIDNITIKVFDKDLIESVEVELSFEDAKKLHGIVLNTILGPFRRQGGDVDTLRDIDRFVVAPA